MNAPVTPLAPSELDEATASLPEWSVVGDALMTTRTLESFPAALAWVQSVGEIAEQLNHHPDIDIRWRTVTLRINTHDAGDQITALDVEFARQVAQLSL